MSLHLYTIQFLHSEPEDDIDLVLEVGRGDAAAVELLVGQASGQLVHLHLVLQPTESPFKLLTIVIIRNILAWIWGEGDCVVCKRKVTVTSMKRKVGSSWSSTSYSDTRLGALEGGT